MRTLTTVLAITAAAFAGSTLYLARELARERERPADPAPVLTAPPVVPATVQSRPDRAPVPVAAAAPPAAPAASQAYGVATAQAVSEADIKRMRAEFSRSFLAQLEDPERREELLAQHRMNMRNFYPSVDQVLGLSREEYARFVDLHARQQVEQQEAGARCMLDPTCDISELGLHDSRNREIEELLGADRARKFEKYQNTMGERQAVMQLRNRLTDSQRLSDADAESLIAALAEERELIYRDSAQGGGGMTGFNIGSGMVFAPAEGGSVDERMQTARRTSQRLRDRAAQFLDAAQLRAFEEMQDETLLNLRAALRNKDDFANKLDAAAVTRDAD